MITVTKKEFENIKCKATCILTDNGDVLTKYLKYGGNTTDQWKKLKKIFIYTNAIWKYDSGEFTELNYVNYLNSTQLQNILAKLRKLI